VTTAQRALIVALVLVAGAFAWLVGRSLWQLAAVWTSIAPGAPIPTSPYTPIALPATWTPSSQQLASSGHGTPAATLDGAPACGGPANMSILLIGSDTRGTGYTWGLADVIRIARFDFAARELSVLDYPRDVWVEIPEISDNLNGQDHEKLNQAYLYGNPGDGFGYWDDPSAGPGLLARTLDLNFGAHVDHYLAVNMQTFVRMVDALDGIDVTLPRRVGGSTNPHLQAGTHHLDGAEALALARDRGEGVFSRGENQNLVLCGLQDKLRSPAVLAHVPELIQSFQGSVQTDLDLGTMTELACLVRQIPAGNIAFHNFPEALFTGDRVYDPVFEKSLFIWDFDSLILRNYVQQFQEGKWPDSGSSQASGNSTVYCR